MLQTIKSKIAASLKNKKVNVFFLFLLFSFVILIFSKLSKNYTNTVAFRIDKLNVPEEHVILNDSFTLNVTLRTHGFKWFNYYFKDPKVEIDFSKDVIKRDKFYIWNQSLDYINSTQFDNQVELLNISPDTIVFKYDANMVKRVPIKLDADIKFSAGYNAVNTFQIEPDSVTVIGPEVLVSKINALETEELALEEVRTNVEETIAVKLPENNQDLKFSTKEVQVNVAVKKFTEGTVKVPVSIINVPKSTNLKYFPKEVTVTYYVSLDNYNSVKANDFKVICNYGGVEGNQSFLIPELKNFPETVKSAKINHQQIEFIITK